jgi:hypothetical protein
MTALRALATALADRAVRTLPPQRRSWGEAMRAEIVEIPRDRAALRWALGAVYTTGRLRRQSVSAVSPLPAPVRWLVGTLCLLPFAAALALLASDVLGVLNTRSMGPNYDGLGLIVDALFVLPVTSVIAATWAVVSRWWRRRAGLAPSRLAYRAAVACEVAVVLFMLTLIGGALYLALHNTVTPTELIAAAFDTVVIVVAWLWVLAPLELLRRVLRPAVLRPAAPRQPEVPAPVRVAAG